MESLKGKKGVVSLSVMVRSVLLLRLFLPVVAVLPVRVYQVGQITSSSHISRLERHFFVKLSLRK